MLSEGRVCTHAGGLLRLYRRRTALTTSRSPRKAARRHNRGSPPGSHPHELEVGGGAGRLLQKAHQRRMRRLGQRPKIVQVERLYLEKRGELRRGGTGPSRPSESSPKAHTCSAWVAPLQVTLTDQACAHLAAKHHVLSKRLPLGQLVGALDRTVPLACGARGPGSGQRGMEESRGVEPSASGDAGWSRQGCRWAPAAPAPSRPG